MSLNQAIDEIQESCRMLKLVIMQVHSLEDLKEEMLQKLDEHTNHCAESCQQMREAFNRLHEENIVLKETLVELETEINGLIEKLN